MIRMIRMMKIKTKIQKNYMEREKDIILEKIRKRKKERE